LWAVKLLLSQASVTSTKSSSSRRCRKLLRMLEWKSFHLREYCCSPLDEDDEAAMAPVPPGPTAEGTSGAIVLSLPTTAKLRLSSPLLSGSLPPSRSPPPLAARYGFLQLIRINIRQSMEVPRGLNRR
jgi:hypothetical protein